MLPYLFSLNHNHLMTDDHLCPVEVSRVIINPGCWSAGARLTAWWAGSLISLLFVLCQEHMGQKSVCPSRNNDGCRFIKKRCMCSITQQSCTCTITRKVRCCVLREKKLHVTMFTSYSKYNIIISHFSCIKVF